MNKTLESAGRQIIKDLLSECTVDKQMMFKRMYAKGKVHETINMVVDNMDSDRINVAIQQCERTVEKNKKTANRHKL